MTTSQPRLVRRFLDRIAASPRGRAFLLQFLVNAEEADEVGVFDQLLARIDDPQLHKLAQKHRDDEDRQARVVRGRGEARRVRGQVRCG